jgi:hypothetical protein
MAAGYALGSVTEASTVEVPIVRADASRIARLLE